MLQRRLDERFLNYLVGNEASRGLSDLRTQLALVQSAGTLALEGTTRATASQIAARAYQDFKVAVTASWTGQYLSSLGINSVTTHGKNKFVLDVGEFERIREDIAASCEKALAKLEEMTGKFQDLPKKIEALQQEWKQILATRSKEQELVRLINADRQNPPRIDSLEAEYKKIQQRDERISQIQNEVKVLALKEKRLPSLEEQKKALEARISEHEKKIQTLAEKEYEVASNEQETDQKISLLAKRIEKLSVRIGWVDMATLNQEIETARKELEQLSKQLGEKRTLLDRLLHRKEGGPK